MALSLALKDEGFPGVAILGAHGVDIHAVLCRIVRFAVGGPFGNCDEFAWAVIGSFDLFSCKQNRILVICAVARRAAKKGKVNGVATVCILVNV